MFGLRQFHSSFYLVQMTSEDLKCNVRLLHCRHRQKLVYEVTNKSISFGKAWSFLSLLGRLLLIVDMISYRRKCHRKEKEFFFILLSFDNTNKYKCLDWEIVDNTMAYGYKSQYLEVSYK